MKLGQLAAIFLGTAMMVSALPGYAQAGPIYFGTGWSVPIETARDVPPADSFPGSEATEIVQFTADALNFSGDCEGCYNLGGFLSSGGALLSATYLNGADASTDLDGTLWQFTGTALFTNGQTYSVRHDDGVRLYVNGIAVLAEPLFTPPVIHSFTYTGETGNQSFSFLFANCCATEADFQIELTPAQEDLVPAPEPGSLVLLGTGLLAAARARRRRRA